MKKEEIIRRCYGGMKERHGVETNHPFPLSEIHSRRILIDAETITRITEVPGFQDDGGGYTCHQDFRRRLGRM